MDYDLMSIQNVRDCVNNAYIAQKSFASFTQDQVDSICFEVAKVAYNNSKKLGKLANEETGFGVCEHKEIKNQFASKTVYESIKDMKTVGVIGGDIHSNYYEVASPVGVIAAIIPSTNPTSTTIYKILLALKSRNAIVISPHPSAKNCILETAKILSEVAYKCGVPKGLIQCITHPSLEGTTTLMKHDKVNLILATGGGGMVKAAYSSGNPAIGVGPGNGPVFIEKSANVCDAVSKIVESKTFDNGVICASEQAVVVEECLKDKVITEMKNQNCYFLSNSEKEAVSSVIYRPNGSMNPGVVGKSALYIADLANINVPKTTKILVGFETEVGRKYPFSREKLCPVLGFYVRNNWVEACELCITILMNEGAGHTMTIHSTNDEIINEFGLKKPVNRLLVNTNAAQGGVGLTTLLEPAFTLGCGAISKSSTSDNITPLHLINIKRVVKHNINISEVVESYKKEFSLHTKRNNSSYVDKLKSKYNSEFTSINNYKKKQDIKIDEQLVETVIKEIERKLGGN